MGDHADHIHVGFRPLYGANSQGSAAARRGAQAVAVDQADRPPRRDRQPDGAPQPSKYAVEGHRAGQPSPQGRVDGGERPRPPLLASSSSSSPGALGPGGGPLRRAPPRGRRPAATSSCSASSARRAGAAARPRRPRRAAPGAGAAPVDVTRATVVGADPLPDDGAAPGCARRGRARGDGRRGARRARTARCTRTAVAAATRYVPRSRAGQALATRVGFGDGRAGRRRRWTAARELPPPRGEARAPRCARRSASRRCSRPRRRAGLRGAGAARPARPRPGPRARGGPPARGGARRRARRARGLARLTGLSARLDELPTPPRAGGRRRRRRAQGGLDEPEQTAAVAAALGRLEAALRARVAEL